MGASRENAIAQILENSKRLDGFIVVLDARLGLDEVVIFGRLRIAQIMPAIHSVVQTAFRLRYQVADFGRKLVAVDGRKRVTVQRPFCLL